jgi:hypothetical protein
VRDKRVLRLLFGSFNTSGLGVGHLGEGAVGRAHVVKGSQGCYQ